jgi:hypothetical protein
VTSDEGSPVRPGNKLFALAIRSRLSARQSEVRSNSLASSSQDAASREKRNLSAASWDRFCYFHAKILAFAANQNAFIHSIEYCPCGHGSLPNRSDERQCLGWQPKAMPKCGRGGFVFFRTDYVSAGRSKRRATTSLAVERQSDRPRIDALQAGMTYIDRAKGRSASNDTSLH